MSGAGAGDTGDTGGAVATADPGGAQERTLLAWRRTGLALLVGAVTIGRLTLDVVGPVVLVPAVLTAGAALWVLARGARSRHPVGPDGSARPADGAAPVFSVLREGRMPAVVTVTLVALALGELLAALGTRA